MCTNNRNIHFCTLEPLVWKLVELHCVKNSEESVNYNSSYHTESILSTNGQRRRRHNIIQL